MHSPSLETVNGQLTRSLARLQAVRYFGLLGKVTAKALQDGRLLDLPLSPVFYRLALGGRVDLYDIRKFDAGLGGWQYRILGSDPLGFTCAGGPGGPVRHPQV